LQPLRQAAATVITLYGIKNCDTVRKARKWLDSRNVEYRFHDFREDGIDQSTVADWLAELGWESLVNRRSTSWKALDTKTQQDMDARSALTAILDQPTLIKRPLLDTGSELHVGFSPESYARLLNLHTL